jgi:hypothetical protein
VKALPQGQRDHAPQFRPDKVLQWIGHNVRLVAKPRVVDGSWPCDRNSGCPFGDGEVGQPFGLDHRAIALGLLAAQHAHGGPVEGFPRGKVVGVTGLDTVVPFLEYGVGRLAIKASTSPLTSLMGSHNEPLITTAQTMSVAAMWGWIRPSPACWK